MTSGKWPTTDACGRPIAESAQGAKYRAELAGTDLIPSGHRATFCLTAPDWKYAKGTFQLAQSYDVFEICHRCLAENGAGPLAYNDARMDASCFAAPRTHAAFQAEVVSQSITIFWSSRLVNRPSFVRPRAQRLHRPPATCERISIVVFVRGGSSSRHSRPRPLERETKYATRGIQRHVSRLVARYRQQVHGD